MTKFLHFSLFVLSVGFCQTVHAQCNGGMPASCGCPDEGCCPAKGHVYHDSAFANRYWYDQYVWPSRRAICQSYATMVNNGWRRNNLLGEYHFDPKNPQQLSEAGQHKTKWILTQAPQDRRTVFVERGVEQTETTDRLAAVQDYAANLSPSQGPADVQETHIRNEGRPAGAVDAVFTGFSANQAPPVLPQSSSGSSESGE